MKKYEKAQDIQSVRLQRLQDPVFNVEQFPANYACYIDLMKSDIIDWVKEDRTRKHLGISIGEVYVDNGRLFIESLDHDGNLVNELMLRSYQLTVDNSGDIKHCITVARVSFLNRRKGMMTKLYELLTEHVKECNDLDAILIESVVTPEMKYWCLKNGFTAQESSIGNYYKTVK